MGVYVGQDESAELLSAVSRLEPASLRRCLTDCGSYRRFTMTSNQLFNGLLGRMAEDVTRLLYSTRHIQILPIGPWETNKGIE
jgi:hypothetical protein